MSDSLATISPLSYLFRVGRKPNPWSWPDWAHVGPDGTFGNRWDDPDGTYRVLYACSERLGAFVETLARFRPAPNVVAGLAEIQGDDDPLPAGSVPTSWVTVRSSGEASVVGAFADISHSDSLVLLRRVFAARIVHYRILDLDAAAIRMSAPRRFTQEISRFIYQCSLPDGRPAFAGIFYRSRLGDDFHNWAIFERPEHEDVIREHRAVDFTPDDPDLREALRLLELTLVAD